MPSRAPRLRTGTDCDLSDVAEQVLNQPFIQTGYDCNFGYTKLVHIDGISHPTRQPGAGILHPCNRLGVQVSHVVEGQFR